MSGDLFTIMNRPLIISIVLGSIIALLHPCRALIAQPAIESHAKLLPQIQSSMAEIPFGVLVHQMTGHDVIPFDEGDRWQQEMLSMLGKVASEVVDRMNQADSPVRKYRRINEVSREFEDALMSLLDSQSGWSCSVPKNAQGKVQRSGYPDLILTHLPTGRHVYLDPKVYHHKQASSSLRTFYYEPKSETSKIQYEAMHLLIGFAHDGGRVGKWRFLHWKMVDMSKVKVRLKMEFQTSNKEMYLKRNIIKSSGGELDH